MDFKEPEDSQRSFKSRLSFALNTTRLYPEELIDSVIGHWREDQHQIDISRVEGFVRQILSWREYMRGIYWKEMPGHNQANKLAIHNNLPEYYWSTNTKMNYLKHSIQHSLDNAYVHRIPRLMITGNQELLTDKVDAWYLCIEWTEITNARGMSQFVDGGIVATKPDLSSETYINKMSNYWKGCVYDVKNKIREKSCPFKRLYWNYLDDKREFFRNNPRMTMMLKCWIKKLRMNQLR